VPRLPRLLAETGGLEVRIAASASCMRFHTDEFDADIVYDRAAVDAYTRSRQPRIVVLPLGEEIVMPLCAPSMAERVRTPENRRGRMLIESDNKLLHAGRYGAAGRRGQPVQ
jgi:hypothetical protein